MNKIRLTIALLFLINLSFGQLKKNDSVNIAFKAKLLTTSFSGLADSDVILQDILNQEIDFIPNPAKNIILLKIRFNQKYFDNINKTSIEWFGVYDYYLAYNVYTSRFYRLGGFDYIDIDSFFYDLKEIPSKEWTELVFGHNPKYGNIDFQCL